MSQMNKILLVPKGLMYHAIILVSMETTTSQMEVEPVGTAEALT